MAWAVREFSKSHIDRAGATLVDSAATPADRQAALAVVNNWRGCHAFPLNTLQNTTRNLARQVDQNVLVAQRIKRLSSIEQKLQRFKTMTLSQMQDLGGCRAIVSEVRAVRQLSAAFRTSRVKHRLHQEDNYINKPQLSGYRGIHLIYKYFSDRNETYNGQKIEVQLRSLDQHAWATAVETVGTFTRHALKSSVGPDDWLRFFAVMSSTIAQQEGTPLVPGTPADPNELLDELRESANQLEVIKRLRAYGQALQSLEEKESIKGARYFLIELETEARRTVVTGFRAQELEEANARYLKVEERLLEADSGDAVLVSVENVAQLRRAYPNYFLDTQYFTEYLQFAISVPAPKRLSKRQHGAARR
jgi:hypothetical protein